MAKAVGVRPLIVKATVQSQARTCEICGGHSGAGKGCFPSTLVFSVKYHSKILHIHPFIYYLCYIILALKKTRKITVPARVSYFGVGGMGWSFSKVLPLHAPFHTEITVRQTFLCSWNLNLEALELYLTTKSKFTRYEIGPTRGTWQAKGRR